MHVLITGGAGFIGSNLTQELFLRNPHVVITCIDNFSLFYSPAIKRLNIAAFLNKANYRLIEVDIADTNTEALLKLIPQAVDIIVHIAAKAGVRPSIQNPLAYQQTNVIGLQYLLDFAVQNKCKQFVFASSSSVYGVNKNLPWREEEKLLPISPYAMTKQAGEMLGHVYSSLYDIRFIALRFFTVYGPAQRPDLAIHKFIKAMLQGKPITVYGDGSTSRDYTFVTDTVQGIIQAMDYNATPFEIINLGNNYAISLNELIKGIEYTTSLKATVEHLPDQPGDVPHTFADISKAKKLLGYLPQTKLQDGLQSFYEWFLQNKDLLLD